MTQDSNKFETLLRQNPGDVLELISLICGRISHGLRSPLGTAMGVVEDLRRGIELTDQDREDGAQALKTILKLLDLLKEMRGAGDYEPEELDVGKVLENLFAGRAPKELRVNFHKDVETVRSRVDEKLLCRATRCVLAYLSARHSRCGGTADTPLEVRVSSVSGRPVITFQFTQASPRDSQMLGQPTTFAELAELDHSSQSIGLIYVEAVAAFYGGRTEFEWLSDEVLVMRILLGDSGA